MTIYRLETYDEINGFSVSLKVFRSMDVAKGNFRNLIKTLDYEGVPYEIIEREGTWEVEVGGRIKFLRYKIYESYC